MLKSFTENKVTVVVTADQTFVRFLLAQEKLLVPTGVKRVGSNVQKADERKGVTFMLAAYFWKAKGADTIKRGLLPPFIVFNGKSGATLDKRYKDWSRREGHSGSMNFQSKHWFDGPMTIRWINWLEGQFPQSERIGLVWDAFPAHKYSKLKVRLEELKDAGRLYTALIPGGLTSILQLGDITVNGPCKKFLKKQYLSWQFMEIARRRQLGETGRISYRHRQ